ncbi:unnamed protein product [Diatraea saccharalis]|uniref:MADF domain-containing protein n=1 Tax=Diatraea saccharalis TaxID=40085 RepID=A0A9N9QLJ1_9NEOP|nr:unnamed protein product [Diatraea saccharalis]
METFIAGVRAHPCLWNPMHADYREMQVRDDAWQRVVKDCNNTTIPSVKVARATWRKLRDNHREALKRAKLGQNKLLPAQITTWKYAKAMQFLEPHMKYRITENIDSETSEEKVNKPEQDVSTSECTNPTKDSPPQKRRCVEYQNETSTLQQDGDALESFFFCMLKSTREMPPWMQTQVKKKMFAVIIDAEEQLSNENNKVTSHENVFNVNQIKRETFTDDSCDYT